MFWIEERRMMLLKNSSIEEDSNLLKLDDYHSSSIYLPHLLWTFSVQDFQVDPLLGNQVDQLNAIRFAMLTDRLLSVLMLLVYTHFQ